MTHVYCTYFDHNYLPRALLMLRSLRRFDDASKVFVLALSDLCALALQKLALPNVEVIALAEVERTYPELLSVKLGRTPIEYVFTLTPVLPLYVFATTAAERVTYLDADLYFFSSPQPFLETIAEASVAITPHNFSAGNRDKLVYGRFNVGWITYRRCPEGLACLETYKADCLAWCYDRLEDGRFADQRYLDAWPDAYQGVAVVAHKGVNVGAWSADDYEFAERDGQYYVDEDPLICYHCQGIRIEPSGQFELYLPHRQGASENFFVRRLMRPYVARLLRERNELHRRFPGLAGAEVASLRYQSAPPAQAGAPWRYVGKSWTNPATDARRSDAAIGAAISEYFKLEAGGAESADALFGRIIAHVARGRAKVSVLDWRGGVGQSYIVAKASAPHIALDWHVFDAGAYCDYGGIVNPAVRFHESAEDFAGPYDLVFVRGTLGYETDWRDLVTALCRVAEQALMLAPVLVHERETFVVANHPAAWRGAGVNSWVVRESDLTAAMSAAGLAKVGDLRGPDLPAFPGVKGAAAVRTLIFARR